MKKINSALALLLTFILLLSGCDTTQISLFGNESEQSFFDEAISSDSEVFDLSNIPAYSGKPYIEINNNIPYYTREEYSTVSFEQYAPLDNLGRCGVAFANVGKDIMPTEERGSIGMIKPTGWHMVKYDNVDGKYLYNRCHLIGYQLSAENANEQNLITGTRYLNTEGMLPFENMVADYVKGTENHVFYRVTPVFEGDNLLASGVLMEAFSIEDEGEGICFNVYCYNVQPDIEINYADGSSKPKEKAEENPESEFAEPNEKEQSETNEYIANKNTNVFHYPDCSGVEKMKEENKINMTCSRDEAITKGYSPCGNCKP